MKCGACFSLRGLVAAWLESVGIKPRKLKRAPRLFYFRKPQNHSAMMLVSFSRFASQHAAGNSIAWLAPILWRYDWRIFWHAAAVALRGFCGGICRFARNC